MTQAHRKAGQVAGDEDKACLPAKDKAADEPLSIQPGHVMQREHYERLAREAAQK